MKTDLHLITTDFINQSVETNNESKKKIGKNNF